MALVQCDVGHAFDISDGANSSVVVHCSVQHQWETVPWSASVLAVPQDCLRKSISILSYVVHDQLSHVKITRLEKHVSRDIVRVAMSGYNSDISLAALDCGAPPDVPFAYIPEALGSSIYGSRVTYHCVFDYWFARDVYEHVITCDESGEWSDVPINGCRSTFSS